jgi:hypothetical protein
MFFDCTRYEDGETYLSVDASIKCKGDEADRWGDSLPYVISMSVLFPLGIPLYYLIALRGVRNHINPPMSTILKDKDYVSAFALSGRFKYKDKTGKSWEKKSDSECGVFSPGGGTEATRVANCCCGKVVDGTVMNDRGWVKRFRNREDPREIMTAEELTRMKLELKAEWVQQNPIMADWLTGKDYKAQFECKRTQVGYHKARAFIKSKARATSVPAKHFKFLWGPYHVNLWYFEVIDMFRRFLVVGKKPPTIS